MSRAAAPVAHRASRHSRRLADSEGGRCRSWLSASAHLRQPRCRAVAVVLRRSASSAATKRSGCCRPVGLIGAMRRALCRALPCRTRHRMFALLHRLGFSTQLFDVEAFVTEGTNMRSVAVTIFWLGRIRLDDDPSRLGPRIILSIPRCRRNSAAQFGHCSPSSTSRGQGRWEPPRSSPRTQCRAGGAPASLPAEAARGLRAGRGQLLPFQGEGHLPARWHPTFQISVIISPRLWARNRGFALNRVPRGPGYTSGRCAQ